MLRLAARFGSGRLAAALSAACSALSRSCPQLAQDQVQPWSGFCSSRMSFSRVSSSNWGRGDRRDLSGSSIVPSSDSGGKSGGSSGSGGGSSSSEPQPPAPKQAAAADRLLALSREAAQHRRYSHSSDEQLRQRILLMLQLGFSETAIEKHIRNNKGGPYVAWETVVELVALLRRARFSQQQLDRFLEGSSGGNSAGSVYSRAPADVAANLAWLRQQFGLKPTDLAKACRKFSLLQYKVETLQANWHAIVAAYRPTAKAMRKLAYALRRGLAEFLYFAPSTVGNKVAALQELLGLADEDVPDKFGVLACLFGADLNAANDGPAQRFELLQELTGLPKEKLTSHILRLPALLFKPMATLMRKHGIIVQAFGGDAGDAKLLLSRYPDALQGADDRVPRNLATLQRLGCSSNKAAVKVLLANGRLAARKLEEPDFAARVAYWQQVYKLESAEAAMLKSANLLHQSLCTLAPRVAFWRSFRPGQPLPAISTFTPGDATFCKRQKLPAEQFPAFKQQWLASEEGRQVCRWERQGEAAAAPESDSEAED